LGVGNQCYHLTIRGPSSVWPMYGVGFVQVNNEKHCFGDVQSLRVLQSPKAGVFAQILLSIVRPHPLLTGMCHDYMVQVRHAINCKHTFLRCLSRKDGAGTWPVAKSCFLRSKRAAHCCLMNSICSAPLFFFSHASLPPYRKKIAKGKSNED
jgi:hypothetical protein